MWSWRLASGGLRISVSGVLVLALAGSAHAGLTVVTGAENNTIAEDTVVIRLEGPIESPMETELRDIWSKLGQPYERLLLDLDSPGGNLQETEEIVEVLADIRRTTPIDTLVRHDATCASACVAIFVQGTQRFAGGSSTWLFHGACHERSNVPALELTSRFLDILRDAGVAEDFLCHLVDQGYVTTPGKLWVSGYELVHTYHANIITRLLEPWRPEAPNVPQRDPLIGPH